MLQADPDPLRSHFPDAAISLRPSPRGAEVWPATFLRASISIEATGRFTAGTSQRDEPKRRLSFECLNVQLFLVDLARGLHRKQDLGPFLGQTSKDGFLEMIPAATILVIGPGPFRASETGETPVPERTS